MTYLSVLNYVLVLFFGVFLAFFFADIKVSIHRKDSIVILCTLASLQVIIYFIFGDIFLFKSYPHIYFAPPESGWEPLCHSFGIMILMFLI